MPISPTSTRLLASLSFAIALSGCEGTKVTVMDQVNKPIHDIKLTNGVFVHQPSGLRFPVHAGGWTRLPVRPGQETQKSTTIGYEIREEKGIAREAREYLHRGSITVVPADNKTNDSLMNIQLDKFLRKHPEAKLKVTNFANGAAVYHSFYDDVHHNHGFHEIQVARHGNYGLIFEAVMFHSQGNEGYNFLGSLVDAITDQ